MSFNNCSIGHLFPGSKPQVLVLNWPICGKEVGNVSERCLYHAFTIAVKLNVTPRWRLGGSRNTNELSEVEPPTMLTTCALRRRLGGSRNKNNIWYLPSRDRLGDLAGIEALAILRLGCGLWAVRLTRNSACDIVRPKQLQYLETTRQIATTKCHFCTMKSDILQFPLVLLSRCLFAGMSSAFESRYGLSFSSTTIVASRVNSTDSIELTAFPASSDYRNLYTQAVYRYQTSDDVIDEVNVESIFESTVAPMIDILTKQLEQAPEIATLFLPSIIGC